jgi:hypothetical protein
MAPTFGSRETQRGYGLDMNEGTTYTIGPTCGSTPCEYTNQGTTYKYHGLVPSPFRAATLRVRNEECWFEHEENWLIAPRDNSTDVTFKASARLGRRYTDEIGHLEVWDTSIVRLRGSSVLGNVHMHGAGILFLWGTDLTIDGVSRAGLNLEQYIPAGTSATISYLPINNLTDYNTFRLTPIDDGYLAQWSLNLFTLATE